MKYHEKVYTYISTKNMLFLPWLNQVVSLMFRNSEIECILIHCEIQCDDKQVYI